jgi:hypothetical protein
MRRAAVFFCAEAALHAFSSTSWGLLGGTGGRSVLTGVVRIKAPPFFPLRCLLLIKSNHGALLSSLVFSSMCAIRNRIPPIINFSCTLLYYLPCVFFPITNHIPATAMLIVESIWVSAAAATPRGSRVRLP